MSGTPVKQEKQKELNAHVVPSLAVVATAAGVLRCCRAWGIRYGV